MGVTDRDLAWQIETGLKAMTGFYLAGEGGQRLRGGWIPEPWGQGLESRNRLSDLRSSLCPLLHGISLAVVVTEGP